MRQADPASADRVEKVVIRLAALDVAGTTVQITDHVPRALTDALATHGFAVSAEQIRALRGISKRKAIAMLISDGVVQADMPVLVDSVMESFRESLLASYEITPVSPIDGTIEVLALLRESGIGVWLTTGFDREMAELVIGRAGLTDSVDGLACDDDVIHGRPSPELIHHTMKRSGVSNPEQVVAVGDTVADLDAAAAAGVGLAVGVLSGAHDIATLSDAPHDMIVSSIAELPRRMEEAGLL